MRRLSRVLAYAGRCLQSTSPALGPGKGIEKIEKSGESWESWESELVTMAEDALVTAGYSTVPGSEEIYNLSRSAMRLGDVAERLALLSLSSSGALERHREEIDAFLRDRAMPPVCNR
jgi:hypothetical protein